MSLWILILAYLIVHALGRYWQEPGRTLNGSGLLLSMNLLQRLRMGQGFLLPSLAPLLIVIPLALLQWWLDGHSELLWFLLSLLVVTWSLGPNDLDNDVKAWLQAEAGEEQDRLAERLACDYRHSSGRHNEYALIRGIFYQSLVRWFGVMFWFLALGASGALLFRLVHAQLSDSRVRARLNGRQRAVCKHLVGWLDLLPAALATLATAIVGDFERVTRLWRQHFVSQHKSLLTWDYAFYPNVGLQTVLGDDDVETAFEHDYEGRREQVNKAMTLVWRTVACWITVIALLILVDWLS